MSNMSNINNINNFNMQNINNKNFFNNNNSKIRERRKLFLPSLINNFKDIEKNMSEININLSQAVNEIDSEIENGIKYKDKYKKEFHFKGN